MEHCAKQMAGFLITSDDNDNNNYNKTKETSNSNENSNSFYARNQIKNQEKKQEYPIPFNPYSGFIVDKYGHPISFNLKYSRIGDYLMCFAPIAKKEGFPHCIADCVSIVGTWLNERTTGNDIYEII